MKLSRHYNKVSFIITFFILCFGAVIYFVAINFISRSELDRELTEEIDELTNYIISNNQLPKLLDFGDYRTVFSNTNTNIRGRRFFDTLYNNPKENQIQKARAVEAGIFLNGKHLRVNISISKESTEYLLQLIAIITLVLLLSLLVTLVVINKYVLNKLWRPFYDLLAQAKSYEVAEGRNFQLARTDVDEFVEMKKAMNVMSARVTYEFQNLKHFTENASHELMTPLSVITSRLDMLIQDESLNAGQYEQLQEIYTASAKLSKLNHSLLLLVKIENNLVGDVEPISIDVTIFEKLRQFQELIGASQISVTETMVNKWIHASKYLIDILLNNLFSNVIRLNVTAGSIIITLTDEELLFQNSGDSEALDPNTVFDRFQKSRKSEGTGLGLAIIKNICILYNWTIKYSYHDNMHSFCIKF